MSAPAVVIDSQGRSPGLTHTPGAVEMEVVDRYTPPKVPNPQAWGQNAELVDEYMELLEENGALHGQRPPNLNIVHEKPEHRFIVYLKSRGFSNREVAGKTGYTEAWISQLTRQPWFVKRLIEELRAAGQDGLQQALEMTKEDTLVKLVHLRDNAKSEAVQLAATINLADRTFGKPIQRTEVKLTTTKTVVQRYEDMQTELAELEKREQEIKAQLANAAA